MKNAFFAERVFHGGEGGVRISSPLWGRATGNKKRILADTFLCGGEGGRRVKPCAEPELIVLNTGTSIKEALLIIDHRQNGSLDLKTE